MSERGPVTAGGDGEDTFTPNLVANLGLVKAHIDKHPDVAKRMLDYLMERAPSSGAPEGEGQTLEALFAEALHRFGFGAERGAMARSFFEQAEDWPGEGQPEAWQDGFNAGVESVLGEGQLTAEEAEAVAGKRSKREEWCNCARHRGIRKLRALSRESRA